jgi:hypothetical protein
METDEVPAVIEEREPCLRCDRWGRLSEMLPLWGPPEANGQPLAWVHKRCAVRHRYAQLVPGWLAVEWVRDWEREQPVVPIEGLRDRARRGRWTVTLQQFRAVCEHEEEQIEKGRESAEQANARWVWPPDGHGPDAR